MGLLYADALGGYSDPSSSGLKHMRADGEWAAPDAGYKFLDATGEWSVPEVGGIGAMSWPEIAELADLAAASPDGYADYIGQRKTFVYGGNHVTARIVDIAKEATPDGGVVGFIFHVYKGMPEHAMNESGTNVGGYAASEMRTWLESLEFPEGLQPQEFVLRYRPSETESAQSINVTVGLMAAANLFWEGCAGIESWSPDIYSDEGEPYRYFLDHDTEESRYYYDDDKEDSFEDKAWFLSPVYEDEFMETFSGGLGSESAYRSYVPSVRFCLGHYKAEG